MTMTSRCVFPLGRRALPVALLAVAFGLPAAAQPAAAGCDQEHAKALYEQAGKLHEQGGDAPDHAGVLALLSESMQACPTFKVGYQRAKMLLFDLGRADEAFAAASRVQSELLPPNDPRAAALIRGLLGAIQAQRGESCDGLTGMQEARAMLGTKTPRWLEERYLALDRELAEQGVVPADTIECVLTGRSGLPGRALGVKARKVELRIHFATDSDRLEPDGMRQVNALAQALSSKSLTGKRIRIIGHTDARGTPQHNQDLSERRARSVAAALGQTEPGVARNLDTEGCGETQLLDGGQSEAAHRMNRRVEVSVEQSG